MYNSKVDVRNKIRQSPGQIAILIDPEKVVLDSSFDELLKSIEQAAISFIFVGGSTVTAAQQTACIARIKSKTQVPVVIFPGSAEQIDAQADALLFLNLISGRNPEYLIGQQVAAVPKILQTQLEVIPTAYLLVDGGVETMVQKVSKTKALQTEDFDLMLHTSIAGVLMGHELVYLDAGSGAMNPVSTDWIKALRAEIRNPIIVGGGIRTVEQISRFFDSGANLVVVGNHVESNPEFIRELALFNSSHSL